MSFAVAPLRPAVEEAFCCDWGTVVFCSPVEDEDMALDVKSVLIVLKMIDLSLAQQCARAYVRSSCPRDDRKLAYPL